MSSALSSRSSVDSVPSSPTLATGSTSRLILLPNADTRDPLEEYTTDDEDENEDDDSQPGINQLPIPPLSPSVVFLYLLSPYLRLGAIYASDIGDTSLPYSLAGLILAASLSAFCRQIWFLLGRYLRKSSTEDILIHTFARRRRRVRKYGLARFTLTIISGLFRLLLAAMYLRGRFLLLNHVPLFLILLANRFCRLCASPPSPGIDSIPLPPQYLNHIIYSGIRSLSLQVSGLQAHRVHNRSLDSFVSGMVSRGISFLCRERTFVTKFELVPTRSVVE